MKKLFLILLMLSVFLTSNYTVANSGEIIQKDYWITVTTSGVTVAPRLVNRRYLLVVNLNRDYDVWWSTKNGMNASNYSTWGCRPIPANYGSWEEAYSVTRSTYYACTTTGTANVSVTEKE